MPKWRKVISKLFLKLNCRLIYLQFQINILFFNRTYDLCSTAGNMCTVQYMSDLDGVVGEGEVHQSRRATERPTVQAVNIIPGEVQADQLLYLPQLRLGHHADEVARQVQLSQAALHRVQRPHRDLQEVVVRHVKDLQLGGLEVGCPSKLVLIRNNRNWNRVFSGFASITKQSFDGSIEPKQTEDPPKQFERDYIWVFFRKFRVVSFCFSLLRNSSVCFSCFEPKFFAFGFTKQTRNRSCLGSNRNLFLFVSRTLYLEEALGKRVEVVAREVQPHKMAQVSKALPFDARQQVVGEAEPLEVAVHLQGRLFDGLEAVLAEVQVDKATEVAEAGGCDQPQLVVSEVEDLEDGGERLEEAGLDVGDVVEGEIQGPGQKC
jgi:hypothetical protein